MHLHPNTCKCIELSRSMQLHCNSRPRDHPARHRESARLWWRDSSAAGLSGRARRGSRRPAPRWHRPPSRAPRRPRPWPGASRSRSIRSMVRLRAPPPATIQLCGAFGSSGTIRAIAAAVKAVSVAAPSAGAISPQLQRGKIVAVERFWRRQRKERHAAARARSRPRRPCPARRTGPRNRTAGS